MFLKQLEIVGFKSFAKKATIDFVPGVTAVVGPNGSGKSNITDAIKWVLGEQSVKTLRGAKMEDIIFAGSDSKRALNMAEVTLLLDNRDHHINVDYSEVSVTRRVYRSGESEFMLNGQKCRLKDIIDLFMDSGLGREAYSIISQGKIDDILNSKADEKRKIFEEAAGVLKYKTRKQQAEKKLTDSQEHLNRVEDIIHELDGQVGPLEIQASIAKDYLEKKASLESIEVALLAHDIEVTHQKWEEKAKEVEELQGKDIDLSSEARVLEAKGEQNRGALQAYDQSIEELQESLLLVSEQLEKTEGQKNVLDERRKNAEATAQNFALKLEELTSKHLEIEAQLQSETTLLNEQRTALEKEQNELAEKLALFENFEQGMDEKLEKLKADYFNVRNRQTSLNNERRYLAEQLDLLKTKRSQLEQDKQFSETKRAGISGKEQELAVQLTSKEEELKAMRARFETLDQTIEKQRHTYERDLGNYQKISNTIEQAISRRDMLKEMEEDYAGFFGGVKLVLKAANKQLKGIHGAVAELIQVNKSYETAIETALGGAMQNIVVETEADGREAIQFLKKRQGGRATFLPLSVMKSRQIAARDLAAVQNEEGFVGMADALVRYESKFHGVIRHLLGNVVIARDLKSAGTLANLLSYRYRIVTLDGDVISPGGAMSGGSRKQTTVNLLGRQGEIEQLTAKIKEMQEQKETAEAQIIALRQEIQETNREARQTREALEKLMEESRALEAEHKELLFEVKTMRDRQDLLSRDQTSFAEESESVALRLEKLTSELDGLSETEKALNQAIEDLTYQKKNQEESKRSLNDELTNLKVSVGRQQEVVSAQSSKVDRLQGEKNSLENEIRENEQAKMRLGEVVQHHSGDRETIRGQLEVLRKDKEAVTKWISERRSLRLALYETMQEDEAELKEIKRLHRGITEALRREEVALERLDVELETFLNTLREDYELGYESAKENYPLTLDEADARRQVKLIKRAIEELGNVNIGAIDEFERVSTRLAFLNSQRDDLLEAKQTLLDVIEEMDEEVSKRFEESFRAIRSHFQNVFSELFGGGRADLVLTDPDNYLESGVDILAQPPGKKLQHLSLLSGGERALTAIALLFAILKVRPVPFCVLDEVEAALDDANVDRYADYLTKFSKETQFIVVTHRKGTMEKADVLYGVTMQESGISKLVSVRLEETAELVG